MANLMESLVGRQLKSWQQQKAKLAEKSDEELSDKEQEPMPFISISREYGCGGFEIASIISEKLNNEYKAEPPWAAYDKNILEQLSSDMGLSTELAETLTADARNQITELFSYAFSNLPSQLQVYKKLAEIVRTLATKGNVIIVGRGGNILTQDMKGGLQVKIVAP
ncbi:MAG: cytidylate kinase-like family protein, partial [archaeon]|nr:cytidylate kinase-like family protein [archaeon]